MNAMPAVDTTGPEVEIESTLLGSLAVPSNQAYTFEHGLLGLPEARTFVLLPAEREGFFWLQNLESPALTFLLIDPFRFVQDYTVDLGPTELGELGPAASSDILLLSVLTLPKKAGDPATANLQGPLVFNLRERRARQVVLDSPYGLRFPVALRRRSAAE